MTLRHRLAHLERQRERYAKGSCPHGVDLVDTHEPERPAPRCEKCGRAQFQIVMREEKDGLPWSSPERFRWQ